MSVTYPKRKFAASKSAEREYNAQLRRVAKQVGHIIDLYSDGAVVRPGLQAALSAYAQTLQPWAAAVASKMLAKVNVSNFNQWRSKMNTLGVDLKVDQVMPTVAALQSEQVALITSIPIDAGERAQKLALEAVTGSRRANDVARDIANSADVTASRATLIARTEIAKANSVLTQARSAQVGATHYIWRTADDADVRDSHAEMEGQVVAWDDPPTLSDGTVTHAGQFPNCRCYPEPIVE